MALTIAALGTGCSDGGTAGVSEGLGGTVDRMEKAAGICEEHMAEIAELQPRLGSVSASSVGEIRQVLADLGKDPIPEWADLSDGDFIAVCGYPLGEPDPLAGPTTTCSDGEVRSLAEPSQAQYLVTDSGLAVRDVTQDLSPFEPLDCP
ncbi:MAG: hypothetical protein ACK4V6_01700 [Microthrixaceae bacterium]